MKKFGGIVSLIIMTVSFGLNCIYGANAIEINSVLLMLAFLMLLVFEAVPVTLACFTIVGIMPILGVTKDFNSALSGFSNPVVFFILASFGIALALTKVPLSKRFLKSMLLHFGKNTKLLVLAFMVCTALISSVISNVPACAVFLSVVTDFLMLCEEEDRKKTGKTLMIGIPIASMAGGIMTPAGSSINLLAISLLEKYTGKTISFVQWMCVGIPIAVIILPLAWFLLIKIFSPSETEKHQLESFITKLEFPEKLTPEEKKVLLIFGVMFSLWLISSWIPQINVMVVALLGCCVFCAPKLGVLNVGEFIKNVSWDSFFLVGTVLTMGNVLVQNGVSDAIVRFLPVMKGVPVWVFLLYIAFITFFLLAFIPVAPSFITLMTPVVIQAAYSIGIGPEPAVLVCAVCACNCYLFPLDTVCLLTYSKGYYKMTEMARVTLLLQASVMIVVSALGAIASGLFGWN